MASAAPMRSAADDPFAENIRKTDPLTPAQEQKAFHLPPGFEIQLVASEPEIGKVMNMAFDARGRLWITQSREYPFPAPTNAPARDAVQILSDFAPDGHARKVTKFATGLNLPIGLMPYRDGVIAFSIPNIYYFADTNADDQADTRDYVIGSIGYDRDTHGLTSSFRRGFDGWVYADHGFNNNTTLKARDGGSITMNSGNTYRFQPDGSRVQQNTWGQVNPFGLMFDPLGDLWSADCHSSPVYQLLRGAYYPSFGKPHDGLGFGPNVCDHLHGSTAIAGMVFYAATNFPPEYRGNTYVGNVMTCRINRDTLEEHGSSRLAREAPDFLSSDDPWFRPVDLQLGPDGAIYVADFYNRIIGHYEVPLDHPGRDRERGRIWRILYRGDHATPPAPPVPTPRPSGSREVRDLVNALADPNLTVRMLAMNQLVDRIGAPAIQPVERAVRQARAPGVQKAHGLWVLQRLNALPPAVLAAAATDHDFLVRVHAQRILSETFPWTPAQDQLALAGLRDANPYVQRAAADALGTHPQGSHVRPLLELRQQSPPADIQLRHVVRMALRNQLRAPDAIANLPLASLDASDSSALADVALGLQSPGAGTLVLHHARKFAGSREAMLTYLRHAARCAPDGELDGMATLAREKFADDPDTQFALLKSVQDGLAQRGAKFPPGLRAWAAELATQFLAPGSEASLPWVNVPQPIPTESPWFLQKRPSADGDSESLFLCSLPPNGESLTGILRSRAFALPSQLSFYLAGHDGYPDRPPGRRNLVRLRLADSQEIVRTAPPPRNDTAQLITWELKAYAGRTGILEVVDGDTGDAYAWLAIGRLNPPVVPLPGANPGSRSQRPVSAAELIRSVPLPEFADRVAARFSDSASALELKLAAARALLGLDAARYLPLLAGTLADTNEPSALREPLGLVLADQNSPVARAAVLETLRVAPQRSQIKLALALAGNAAGATALLDLVTEHKLSPQVLADRAVKEKLSGAKVPGFAERYAALTRNLTPGSVALQKLIDTWAAGYDATKASAERGRVVFEKACSICHQIDGKGAVIGPQLDGVGNRGLDRLAEDVLDPSRNIDPAFRPSLVTLRDDTSITGLQRREEGESVVFADAQGKEISVPKKEIAERRESQLSLMPGNFGDLLPVAEFHDLMTFLLAHGAKSH